MKELVVQVEDRSELRKLKLIDRLPHKEPTSKNPITFPYIYCSNNLQKAHVYLAFTVCYMYMLGEKKTRF